MEVGAEIEFKDIIKRAGFKVISPEKYDIPSSDLSKFPEDKREAVDEAIKTFVRYLKFPIIADNYKGHRMRRDARNRLREKIQTERGIEEALRFESFLRSNKVKRNTILATLGYVEFLEDEGVLPNTVTKELITLVRKNVLSHVPLNDVRRLIGELSRDGQEKSVIGLNQIINSKQYDEHGVVFEDIKPLIPNYGFNKGIKYEPYLVDPWGGPTTPEKIAIVGKISEKVVGILNFLGKKD